MRGRILRDMTTTKHFFSKGVSMKRAMPTKQAIFDYWRDRLLDLDGWDRKVNEFCWACGFPSMTHRCHIVAKCDGGQDTVENLMLLCPDCHKLQESQCATPEGRQQFLIAMEDGAPYMAHRYRLLESVAKVKGLIA